MNKMLMTTNDERGLISWCMSKLFGANWSASVPGYIAIVSVVIHQNPTLLHWIPEPLQKLIWDFTEWTFLGGMAAWANRSKAKNVTGGIVSNDLPRSLP